jgi:hypothetical protein
MPPQNRKLTKAQSFSVSEDEKLSVEVLAAGEGIKGGTFARHMYYRGVALYLGDRHLSGEATEEEIFEQVEKLISTDPKLSRLAALKRELLKTAGEERVYSAPNLDEQSREDEGTAGKKDGPRSKARR